MFAQNRAGDPIGVFDSGIGGLSVMRFLRQMMPQEHLLYVADQAHVPYGPRSQEEVGVFSESISRFLLENKAKLIVVACNTASAAALTQLRTRFNSVPFVGMEPAVKPGVRETRSGKVGILATPHTLTSPRYASLMNRYANDVDLFEDPCPGLVELIESGEADSSQTESLLSEVLQPMLAQGVDTIVLGCTHYPFVRPTIERIIQRFQPVTKVTIIDPAPAIARQTRRLLETHQLETLATEGAGTWALTTGDLPIFARQISQLLSFTAEVGQVQWRAGNLLSAEIADA